MDVMYPKHNESASEQLLLNRIAVGDELAFRLVFDKHRKRIYSYTLIIVKNTAIAEDILHDVFLNIWQHKNPAEIENLVVYLKVAARNKAFKILRRQQLEIKTNYELMNNWQEGHNETEESILYKDASYIINKAIELLPPQQKMVYTLCRKEDLKYNQVAERLSLSPLTVKTHMQHALRFLRTYVSKNSDVTLFVILLQILIRNK
jgi:RNA polymerase sigma-70 factor (family 1)